MRQPVTAALLHHLVAGSHAQGTTQLAVAAVIEDNDRVLLISTGDCWDVPGGLVLPGEALTDAVHRTAAAHGIHIDRVTGYLGHQDWLVGGDLVRTFIFVVTPQDPGPVCCGTPLDACRWAAIDDLPDGLDDDILALIYLAAPAVNADHPDQDQQLPAALRAHARGLPPSEAAVELLIGHRCWLRRHDFVGDYIETAPGLPNAIPMACVDWPAAITALDTATLPCSRGEARMLRIAASLAEGIPVDLRDALTGLDTDNLDLVIQAVLHTGGK